MLARFQNHNNVSTARCKTRGGRACSLCWWAAAGPGRASSRRAERRSRRGRRAGGPPPTGTHSGLNEHQQHWKRRRCGGYRRVRRAKPQCWWAAAGPGRASSRRAEHQQHCKRRRCGGCRRVRRARAGFEIDHSERSSRVAISRAAGPDGARNNSGTTRNAGNPATHSTGARTRRPAPLDATTQTQLRSTCVRCRSAHVARRSRRSSRSPRLRRRAGPRR